MDNYLECVLIFNLLRWLVLIYDLRISEASPSGLGYGLRFSLPDPDSARAFLCLSILLTPGALALPRLHLCSSTGHVYHPATVWVQNASRTDAKDIQRCCVFSPSAHVDISDLLLDGSRISASETMRSSVPWFNDVLLGSSRHVESCWQIILGRASST